MNDSYDSEWFSRKISERLNKPLVGRRPHKRSLSQEEFNVRAPKAQNYCNLTITKSICSISETSSNDHQICCKSSKCIEDVVHKKPVSELKTIVESLASIENELSQSVIKKARRGKKLKKRRLNKSKALIKSFALSLQSMTMGSENASEMSD